MPKNERQAFLQDQTQIIQEIGLEAIDELAFQDILMSKVESDLEAATTELDFIKEDLDNMRSWRYKLKKSLFRCCRVEKSVDVNSTYVHENDDHLPYDQIDRLWRKRYDPEERWAQQMEAQLDQLIEIAEELETILRRQERKAKEMIIKATRVRSQVKNTEKAMTEMV